MSAACRDCHAGLDHCHGTVIRHPLRRPECTDDGCDSPEQLRHTFVIDCDAVGCGCSTSTASAPWQLAAN